MKKPFVEHYRVPAAVILGGLNGLGVTRSLGRGNVPSYVIDNHRLGPGMWSRYAAPVYSSHLHGKDLIASLLKWQKSLGERPVLFNTHEMAVLTLSEYRDALTDAFRFRMPKHEMVLTLQDKARFQELALLHDLPIPRGVLVKTDDDIKGKLGTLRFPIVLKPADKGLVHTGKTIGVIRFADLETAVTGCAHMLEQASEVIAQEWVEGASDQIHFCLFYRGRNGKTVSMFTGRKLASNPPGIGLTAYCVAATDTRQILEHMTETFLDKVEYAGMGSVEYKWDTNHRRFVIIEPTVGRTDWQEEIATLCGLNIPLDAYRHELELPALPAATPRADIVWRASFFERLRTERPPFPKDAIVYDGYWRLQDPMPGMIQYSYGAMAAAFRRLRK